MRRCNFQCKVRTQRASIQHNRLRIDVASGGQVQQRRFRIFAPPRLARVNKHALSVTAIVKREHVHTSAMQAHELVDRVAQVPVLTMQIKNGVLGIGRRNPPTLQLRRASI